jgi:hypothetical protein
LLLLAEAVQGARAGSSQGGRPCGGELEEEDESDDEVGYGVDGEMRIRLSEFSVLF